VECWGTQETVDFLIAAANKVNEQFPGTPKMYIGDISSQGGGRLNRHVSHQSGRDVDVSYFMKEGSSGSARQTNPRWICLAHGLMCARCSLKPTLK